MINLNLSGKFACLKHRFPVTEYLLPLSRGMAPVANRRQRGYRAAPAGGTLYVTLFGPL
jgi:hypothetical protein